MVSNRNQITGFKMKFDKLLFQFSGMCEMVIVKDDSEIQLKQRRRLGGGFIDET